MFKTRTLFQFNQVFNLDFYRPLPGIISSNLIDRVGNSAGGGNVVFFNEHHIE